VREGMKAIREKRVKFEDKKEMVRRRILTGFATVFNYNFYNEFHISPSPTSAYHDSQSQ
jgi:hypothetical protein